MLLFSSQSKNVKKKCKVIIKPENELNFFFRLPWNLFFNISVLSSFVPVIEMNEFLQTGKNTIDQVYVLQHFKDMFSSGNFEDRMKVEACHDYLPYKK